ncbi:MAG: hypothetical protein ACE148_14505 [Vicinamibacterales bacterium]
MTIRGGTVAFVGCRRLLSPWFLIFLACIAADAAAVWLVPLLPFTDVPFRLAAATVLRANGDQAADMLRSYYEVRWSLPEPNLLFLFFASSGVAGSVETAAKLWFGAYVVLFPLSVVLLIRRLNGDQSVSLLALPLVFNFNVAWGFAEFAFALPLLLILVANLASYDRARKPPEILWRAVWLAVLLVVLFGLHVQAMLFAALTLLATAVLPGACRHVRFSAAVVLALSAVLLMLWWIRLPGSEQPLGGFLWEYYTSSYVPTFWKRKGIIINDNRQLFAGRVGTTLAFALWVIMMMPASVGLLAGRMSCFKVLLEPGRRLALLLAGAAVGCGLLLPDRVPGQPAVFERFGVLVAVAGIVIGSIVMKGRVSKRACLVMCLLAVVYTGLRIQYFVSFTRDSDGFDRAFLPEAGPDAVLAGLIHGSEFRGHPVYIHFPNYFIVWKHGVAVTEMTEYRFGVIRVAPGAPRLPPSRLFPALDDYSAPAPPVRYVLVRGKIPEGAPLLDEYALEREAGRWQIYGRKGMGASGR